MNMLSILGETPEELERRIVREAAVYRSGAFEALKSATVVSFRSVWYNPALSPSRHFELLDGGAASLFSESSALQQLIKSLDPSWVLLLPTYAYSFSPDGSVTIGARLNPDPNAGNPLIPEANEPDA
jgi:hypothetical protein